jgi:protein-S-isoprenylcysteine O-methyltransferase Ste14
VNKSSSDGIWLSDAWVAHENEYRLRGGPLFLSPLVVFGLHVSWHRSWALPVDSVPGAIAVVASLIGIGVRVWGTAVLSGATMVSMSARTDRLITGGIFGLVRNPMYLGDLLIFPGYTMLLSPWLTPPFALYHIIRVLRLCAYEERRMLARWGDEYEEYCRSVPRLMPRIARLRPAPAKWGDGLRSSSAWIGFVCGYMASVITHDLWSLIPFVTIGFLYFWYHFSRKTSSSSATAGSAPVP